MEYRSISPQQETKVIGIGQLPRVAKYFREQNVGLDLETTGLNFLQNKVVTIQFGTLDEVYILDCRRYYDQTPAEQEIWKKRIQEFISALGCATGHNLKFDWKFLFKLGARMDRVVDTMIQELVIHSIGMGGAEGSGIKVNMLDTGNRYDIPVSKESQIWYVDLDKPRPFFASGHSYVEVRGKKYWFDENQEACEDPKNPGEPVRISNELWYQPFPQSQISYMEQDVHVPLQLAAQQKWKLKRLKLSNTALLENTVLPAVAFQEFCGCYVDEPRWQEIVDIKTAEHAQLEKEIQAELSQHLWNSRRRWVSQVEAEYTEWKEQSDSFDELLRKEYEEKKASGALATGNTVVVPIALEQFTKQKQQQWLEAHPKPKKSSPDYTLWLQEKEQYVEAFTKHYNDLVEQGLTPVTRQPEKIQTFAQYRGSAREPWLEEHPKPRHITPAIEASLMQPINLASPTQIPEALRDLGIDVPNTRAETLGRYKNIPLIEKILRWKKIQKFLTSFGNNILHMIDVDQRIHPTYHQVGARTGRFACSAPNWQQLPAEDEVHPEESVRRCVIAESGYMLLTCDLPNIELRILAELSRDTAMLKAFSDDVDLHSWTARQMFGLPESVDPKHTQISPGLTYRHVAKTINFGLSYGMGVHGLAGSLGVDLETAQMYKDKYEETYATATAFLNRSADYAVANGNVRTLLGRARFFHIPPRPECPARTDEEKEAFYSSETWQKYKQHISSVRRAAKNSRIQGTNADIIKWALILLYRELPEGSKIVACVHDELVCECPEKHVEEAKKIFSSCMLRACRQFLKVVAIPENKLTVSVEKFWKKD